MRIIAGDLKGRRLVAPKGRDTRPIMDRQKEALFNILRTSFPCSLAIDCFAGSGGLGFEALSRGAERVLFVERDRRAADVIRQNARALGVEERIQIFPGDALRFPLDPNDPVGLLFFDPPFPLVTTNKEAIDALLLRFVRDGRLAPDGRVFLRIPTRDGAIPVVAGLTLVDERVMGESTMLLYAAAE